MLHTTLDFDKGFAGDTDSLKLQQSSKLRLPDVLFLAEPSDVLADYVVFVDYAIIFHFYPNWTKISSFTLFYR